MLLGNKGSGPPPLSGKRKAVELWPIRSGNSGDRMRACDGIAVAEWEAA